MLWRFALRSPESAPDGAASPLLGPAGAVLKKFKATGLNRSPQVIRELAGLGALYRAQAKAQQRPDFLERVAELEEEWTARTRATTAAR